jgi:outer membrane protein TolC
MMSRRSPSLNVILSLLLVASAGCGAQQPFFFFEDGDLSHYKGIATDLEVPDVDMQGLAEVDGSLPPLTLTNQTPTEIWDITLEEAVRIALTNSKVLRSLGGAITSAPDSLTRMADAVPTIYDPARSETNPRFGTEAALAAFDAQFSTSVFWEKNDTPRNTYSFGGGDSPLESAFPSVLDQDTGTFQARLSKFNATGGSSSLSHNVRYDWQNTSRRFPSDWNVDVTAEFRQPLWQGAGVQFNRIAGPGAIPGFNNGVVIARIKTDIALADFEAGVRNLVNDVERSYWELYLTYRELDAVVAGRDSSLQTWRKIHSLYELGARGGEAEKEAQAREQYFLFRAQVEERLSNVYAAENHLRYIMGLTSTDGRLARPADEPATAKVAFDWYETLGEGLVRSIDLRRQRWRVKEKELELIAAKNYLLPRFDVVGRYRWRGLGDHLIDANRKPGQFNDAYGSLTGGGYQESQIGLELSFPIGFRKEMAGVRHAQLNLARERTVLKEQELEISHQLAHAVRHLEKGLVLTRTNFNRRIAAKRQVEAVAAAYETDTVTLDLLLDAQRRLAEAEIQFFRSVVGYNLAITEVHFRKGSLLEYNGVYLAEGPWPGKAYFDARRRARARDAGLYMDYGFTRPNVISRGVYEQHAGEMPPMEMEVYPEDVLVPEPIPTPAPEADNPRGPTPDAANRTGKKARRRVAATTPRRGAAKKRTFDLAALDLSTLADKPDASRESVAQESVAKKSVVQPASFQEEVSTPSGSRSNRKRATNSRDQWQGVKRSSTPNEPLENQTPVEADRPASGWKRVQH